MSLSARTDANKRSPSTWELVEEELIYLTGSYVFHNSPVLLYKLEALLNHAETHIEQPDFAITTSFANLNFKRLTDLYNTNNHRRELIDFYRLTILNNQIQWENLRKTCEATYTGYESRDKLTNKKLRDELTKKFEDALTGAEKLIIDEKEIRAKIKNPDMIHAALTEMNVRRNLIDDYRIKLLNNQKAAWENAWNTVSQCAMAYTRYNTKDKLNSLKSALTKAETLILSDNKIVTKIKNPARQKVILEEMKQKRSFIAANRMVIAQTEKTAVSWCGLFARKLFDRKPAVSQNSQPQPMVSITVR